jgi:hypothetical protein
MAEVRISLRDNTFPVRVSIRAVASRKAAIEVDALIDTGASATCLSFSSVAQLEISPTGTPSANRIAGSGILFSRTYPINLGIDGKIFKIIPGCVLFEAEMFFDALLPVATPSTPEMILGDCNRLGIPRPDAWMENVTVMPNGQFDHKFFRPGRGLEQSPILIGMDFMSQLDWAYNKADQALIIDV